MNWITFGIGVFALIYGFCTLYFRFKAPEKFGKLVPMQEYHGPQTGRILHIIHYTIIPIVVGISFIFAGVKGISLWGN